MSRKSARARILDRVATHSGVTSVALLSADLRLATSTVWRHVRDLEKENRITFGWDGNALEITDDERRERAENAAITERRRVI